MRTAPLWLLLSASMLVGGSAFAQGITFDGCEDFRGIPVASIMDPSLQDVAGAGYAPNGAPIIKYNPAVLSSFAPQTRLFWYGHECGHHKLAHSIRNIPTSQEQEADCWSIRTLVRAGLLDDDDVEIVQGDLSRLGRGDWMHLAGPIRAINLQRCLGSGRPPEPESTPRPYCCDMAGRPRCEIRVNPGPGGSPCFCPGQGSGTTCY